MYADTLIRLVHFHLDNISRLSHVAIEQEIKITIQELLRGAPA